MRHAKRFQIAITALGLLAMPVLYTNCGLKGEEASEASVLGAEFSGQVSGELTVIERSGLVMGYAYDARNPGKKMRVHFVANGAGAQGTYLGSVVANGTSAGAFSGYYYSYQIPAAYAGGQTHSLYVYGHEVGAPNLLFQAPGNFAIFLPIAQATYNSSGLNTYVNNTCNTCHGWTYRDLFFGQLSTPNPFTTGSATNNALIRKINGQAGHSGGRFCQVNSDFPCSAIQQWWNAEFN